MLSEDEMERLVCPSCCERFSSQAHLDDHIKDHHVSCTICNKILKHTQSLTRHMVIHSDKRFKCSFCERSFHRLNSMEQHIQKHLDEKAFTCSICRNSFSCRDSLRRHKQRVHKLDLRSVHCPICRKKFRWKSEMIKHAISHSKDKSCPFCKVLFRDKGHIKRHIKSYCMRFKARKGLDAKHCDDEPKGDNQSLHGRRHVDGKKGTKLAVGRMRQNKGNQRDDKVGEKKGNRATEKKKGKNTRKEGTLGLEEYRLTNAKERKDEMEKNVARNSADIKEKKKNGKVKTAKKMKDRVMKQNENKLIMDNDEGGFVNKNDFCNQSQYEMKEGELDETVMVQKRNFRHEVKEEKGESVLGTEEKLLQHTKCAHKLEHMESTDILENKSEQEFDASKMDNSVPKLPTEDIKRNEHIDDASIEQTKKDVNELSTSANNEEREENNHLRIGDTKKNENDFNPPNPDTSNEEYELDPDPGWKLWKSWVDWDRWIRSPEII